MHSHHLHNIWLNRFKPIKISITVMIKLRSMSLFIKQRNYYIYAITLQGMRKKLDTTSKYQHNLHTFKGHYILHANIYKLINLKRCNK